MPRPRRETLAQRILAMLTTGAKPREVAAAVGTSEGYVQVCRSRARRSAAGLMRTRKGYKPTETPEERQSRLKAISAKAHATRIRRREILARQRERAKKATKVAAYLRAEQLRQQRDQDLMRRSSIAYRRAYVQHVLEQWRSQ